jgi:tetratricopeptide (TPR) repeat protein
MAHDSPTPPPPSPADWSAVKALFDQAIALPPDQRAAFLAAATADPAVRAEVASLLAHAADDAGDFLAQPAAAQLAPAGQAAPVREGLHLGPWQLIAPLGAGGMGEVWRAQRADGAYEAQAAVKILKRGMDSASVLARFAQEQRALARLNHPHIARLYDAGITPDGLPYFVMELVEGRPIDQAVAGLALEAKLALFLQLADAVSHAHRQLLVHRDLKPSNVLVDRDGRVKLLDFGIAKAIDPAEAGAADTTQMGQRPFTPHYASPEQVRGEPVGTGTDIYSLGVLLYVLLTGIRPYGRAATTPAEAARSVLEDEPTRPSTLPPELVPDPRWIATRRRLAGDLDNILLKALEKPIERRYTGVDALVADVRAYLSGYPVSARAPGAAYLLAKFAARHHAAVAAGALGLLALAIGAGVAAWQAHEARLARDAARAQLAQLKRLTRDVVFRYGDAVTYLPGGLQVKEQMMLDAVRRLEDFAALAQGDPELRGDLATAWARVAYIQGDETTASLGKPEDAIRHADRAIAAAEGAVEGREGDMEFMLWLSRAHTARGHALRQAARKSEAMASFEAAIALLERGLARQPAERSLRTERATLRHATGQLLYQPGNQHLDRPADALAQLQLAQRELEAIEAERHDVEAIYQLGTVVGAIHLVHLGQGRLDEAIAAGEQAVALRQRSAEEDPSSIVYQDGLCTEANNLGFALLRAMRPAEALKATTLARDTGLLLARQNGPQSKWPRQTRLYATSHGRALAGVGRHAEAIAMFEESEAEWQRMQAGAPATMQAFRHTWVTVQRAKSLTALGRRAEALPLLRQAHTRFVAWSDEAALRASALVNLGEAAQALHALEPGAGWRDKARMAYQSAQSIKPLVGDQAAALKAAGG